MEHSFLSATILLILVTDPLGNIPLFLTALGKVRRERHRAVILRECLIAFLALLVFMVFGHRILSVLHLSSDALKVAGGVILFLIALKMIFPPHEHGPAKPDEDHPEPFIVPLAIPLIAGPSAMATAMLVAGSNPHRMPEWIGALVLCMLTTMVVFLMATRIRKLLGEQAITALERLMGLLLTAISIEMLLSGVAAYILHIQH
jgi:MarC family membrane protein